MVENKRDIYLEILEDKWDSLTRWQKIKIILMVTWATWESQLAYWWLGFPK